jgi:hypothetical protein
VEDKINDNQLFWGGEQDSGGIDTTLPLPVLAGELKATTLTPVGRAPGEPG